MLGGFRRPGPRFDGQLTGQRGVSLYLELLKRSVTNYLYLGEGEEFSSYVTMAAPARYDDFHWKVPRSCRPQTLLSLKQLDLLERLITSCLDRGVEGDFLEAGVWRGGASIFMRGVLADRRVRDRCVWLVDTFAGIPLNEEQPPVEDPVDHWPDRWEASLEEVQDAFRRYELLDERVHFVCGRLRETLAEAAIPPLAMVRIDVDSYESYRDALHFLEPRVADGGFIIIDDWHLPGCVRAVKEYRRRKGIRGPVSLCHDLYWQVRRSDESEAARVSPNEHLGARSKRKKQA